MTRFQMEMVAILVKRFNGNTHSFFDFARPGSNQLAHVLRNRKSIAGNFRLYQLGVL